MMWLGRTEMYLIAPESADPPQTDADIQRQTIDAVLVSEITEAAAKDSLLQEIDGIIQFFTGESDNVTLPNIRSLVKENNSCKCRSIAGHADLEKFSGYRDTKTVCISADQFTDSHVRSDGSESN